MSGLKSSKRVVVIGLGMVGIAFVEKLLDRDPDGQYAITVLGEEPHVAYNRVGLSQYFTHQSIEDLYLNPLDWYTSHQPGRLEYRVGKAVQHIDTTNKLVSLDGQVISYDYCVFATGSEAALPPYLPPKRAKNTLGSFVYRRISDLYAIQSYAATDEARRAVIIGGGLLGLEAAKAVKDLGSDLDVILLERNQWVLSRQLDSVGGSMVSERVRSLGIELRTGVRVENALTKEAKFGVEVVSGLQLEGGERLECQLVVFAVGIIPRDDLAKASGVTTHTKGGIIVKDDMSTNVPDVYAIGECANWREHTYGLIAPGIEMAEILSFNLTEGPKHKMASMTYADTSTRLKLMGVDVASFGDYFADRDGLSIPLPKKHGTRLEPVKSHEGRSDSKNTEDRNADKPSVQCLTYHDPFTVVYKKYLFSSDGKYLVGGMMVGDITDYVKVLSIYKARKPLEIPPSQLILGVPRKDGEEDGDDLNDSAQVCSCHNVSKGAIVAAVKNGCTSIGEVKAKTKAGTGCGGCIPLATAIFNSEMKKMGHTVSSNLCPHFKYSRADLFNIIKIKRLRTLSEVMETCGVKPNALGCEVCKPALASIFSSLYNELIVKPAHHQNQDTNDKWLANVQRNGTYSVVPRVPGGEITPAKLRRIGEVAEEFGLYTKITGGQRIDMFGAQKGDLPDIWEKLIDAGFESGHAYGKALRTVKSCVGTTWCRYGVGDSVKMAIEVENRYKGIRSPHKFKGGVSGCVRECAEAQSKDFGLIATEKGWNVFVGGNGGAKPRHATLLISDAPKAQAIRTLDRFIMFYIRTADRLTRTARWLESLEGGIEYLKRVVVKDELGICEQLDRDMEELVGTYFDEWAAVVNDPTRRAQFRQFVNTTDTQQGIEKVAERGQARPEYWPKDAEAGGLILRRTDIDADPSTDWQWHPVCKVSDMLVTESGSTGVAVKYGDTQLAVFHIPNRGYFASQNMCPHKRAFVLSDGIIGDDPNGNIYVSCPLHKRNYSLNGDGKCLNDSEYGIMTFEAEVDGEYICVKLPPVAALDKVLGTSKFIIRRNAQKELPQVEIVGPNVDGADLRLSEESTEPVANSCGASCSAGIHW